MVLIDRVVEVANELIAISQKLPSNKNQEKAGGYLAISEEHSRNLPDVIKIGNPNPEKENKYLRFSQEKMYRLYSDWLINPFETFSSWQTRNPAGNKYGGAVLFSTHKAFVPSDILKSSGVNSLCSIISCSGFNEHTDEAISLALGHYMTLDDEATVKKIIEVSKNPVYPEMIEAFKSSKFFQ